MTTIACKTKITKPSIKFLPGQKGLPQEEMVIFLRQLLLCAFYDFLFAFLRGDGKIQFFRVF